MMAMMMTVSPAGLQRGLFSVAPDWPVLKVEIVQMSAQRVTPDLSHHPSEDRLLTGESMVLAEIGSAAAVVFVGLSGLYLFMAVRVCV